MDVMPAKILPSKAELQKMLEAGMTHSEIADAIARETGHPVKRSSVSAAVHRAGLSGQAKKYADEIPWTVKERHLTHYAARMLRALGRRRAGIQNSEEMEQRLDSWLEMLRSNRSVVVYLPSTNEGFHYIDGRFNDQDIPIDTTLTEELLSA